MDGKLKSSLEWPKAPPSNLLSLKPLCSKMDVPDIVRVQERHFRAPTAEFVLPLLNLKTFLPSKGPHPNYL